MTISCRRRVQGPFLFSAFRPSCDGDFFSNTQKSPEDKTCNIRIPTAPNLMNVIIIWSEFVQIFLV